MNFSNPTLYLVQIIAFAMAFLITFIVKEIKKPKRLGVRVTYYISLSVIIAFLIMATNDYYSHKKKKVVIDDTITINLLNDESTKFFANTVQIDTPFSRAYATKLWVQINLNGQSKKIRVKEVFQNHIKYSFDLRSIQKAQNILRKLSELERIFNP